jgi:stage II sporulation protein AB (anti-sigma F factor)
MAMIELSGSRGKRPDSVVTLEENLSRSYPAVSGSVAPARGAVVELAARNGASEGQLDLIRLAVSEAVTNAVVHGYRGSGGKIQVIAALASGELWVLVSDEGCGFQTPSQCPGLGWGMPLIAHASDEFAITERAYGGTEVRMRFALDVSSTEMLQSSTAHSHRNRTG